MTVSIENEYPGGREDFLSETEYTLTAESVVREALRFEHCPYEAEVSLLITDDDGIRELNSNFRGIDKSTDVLSFPMIEYSAPADFGGFDDMPWLFDPENGELLLGDIVISADRCMEQAALYGHSPKREFAFLIVHSMLHLFGYDHMEDTERLDMEKRQEEILGRLGISR